MCFPMASYEVVILLSSEAYAENLIEVVLMEYMVIHYSGSMLRHHQPQ
jgi:hypothetical protein